MDALQGIHMVEIGRRIGHDIHHWSQLPRQGDWPQPVREGFDAACAHTASRRRADRFQRKWLQLRLQAWQRGRAVADDVTVALLRHLDVTHCPVTREPLTHGECCDSDWSIDRLNNDGAYAASNLAVLSTHANRAKGDLDFDAVLALARRDTATRGLQPAQWQRLAALMLGPAFASRHDSAPALPLCAPLPACSARLALQQIQRLLTLQARRPAGKNALVRDLRAASHSAQSQLRLRALADAVHEGLKKLGEDQECWDVWLQPGVMNALVRWRESLTAREWALAAGISGHLAGGRRVTPVSLRAWHLPTRGYAWAEPRAPRHRPPPAERRSIAA